MDGSVSAPDWRAIETAPSQADALLLCARNGAVVLCPWPLGPEPTAEEMAQLAEHGVFPDDGWQPAYWMPVPAPPTALMTAEPGWAHGKPSRPQ